MTRHVSRHRCIDDPPPPPHLSSSGFKKHRGLRKRDDETIDVIRKNIEVFKHKEW